MEKEVVVEVALGDVQKDFSANTQTDILDKYSRVHGKTEFSVWCNVPDVKNIDSFRDMIFQIDPYHITCIYKKMFETSAVSNLKLISGHSCTDEERGGHGGPACYSQDINAESDYHGYFQEHVDKSNSCVYSTSTSIKSQSITKGALNMSELHGWDICDIPHTACNVAYQKPVTDDRQDASKRYGKSAGYRALSPSLKTFPTTVIRLTRNSLHGNIIRNDCRGQSQESSVLSRYTDKVDSPTTRSSSSAGSISNRNSAPIQIGRRFRHFKRNSSYMEQYREEYTYQRLFKSRESREARICSCENPFCNGSVTSTSCTQHWYPNESRPEKSKAPFACEKEASKRTPVLDTRPPPAPKQKKSRAYVLQIPKMEDKPKNSSNTGFHRDSIPRLEFFGSSFTVKNYNPVTTQPSPAHKSGCNSASSVIVSCGRASALGHTGSTCSPIHTTMSHYHLLNQNLKGT